MLEKKKVNINTVHLFYCIYYLVVSGVSNLASGVSNIRSQNCNDLLYCYCRFIKLLYTVLWLRSANHDHATMSLMDGAAV